MIVRNRVLLLLAAIGLVAAFAFGFVTHAPNRLLSGRTVPLRVVLGDWHALALLPGVVLLVGPFLPPRRAMHVVIASAAAVFLIALLWLVGTEAAALAAGAPPAARTSLGGAFWALFLCAALMLTDAVNRLRLPMAGRAAIVLAVAGVITLLAAGGAFDELSIVKEYGNRRDVFAAAVARHIVIVAAALVPTLIVGAPLGLLAHRRDAWRAGLFPILNIVQTIPSIALFGMLIAPLSALATTVPALARWGISGIGLAPAVLALILYSLLPIVRNTVEGLAAVPAAAIDAARGMGMTPRQILWRVELPLALPVLVSGLRITAVQAVGLAAVAALIGAGGLGAIMFQGLFANALDLVLLGAIPVILLALAADMLLRVLAAWAERRPA